MDGPAGSPTPGTTARWSSPPRRSSIAIWIGVTGLEVAGLLNPWWLTLSSFCAGFAGAVQFPSWQELERQLVPSDRLQEANALFSSAGATARIFGAVAGGVLVTWVGAGWVFLFNALTFVPLMVVIVRIPASPPKDGRDGANGYGCVTPCNTPATNPRFASRSGWS